MGPVLQRGDASLTVDVLLFYEAVVTSVASLVASSAGKHITGQTLAVDGGLTAT
jgi:hypothetical protein